MNIVITGGSSGIGAALVREFSGTGARVIGCARGEDKLRKLAASLSNVEVTVCDVSDEEAVVRLRDFVRERFPHVDVLINCAGIAGPIGRFDQMESEEWFRTIRVNLFGVYCVTKHLLPLMRNSAVKKIINFAGGGAFDVFENYSAYACSKAAVVRLSENMARELAPQGITVNCVSPGFVDTPFHASTVTAGEERAGIQYHRVAGMTASNTVPVEVPVRCVEFLISPQADGLTGKTISASFDTWDSPSFQKRVPEINASDLFTLRRINVQNLEDGELKSALIQASHDQDGGMKGFLS